MKFLKKILPVFLTAVLLFCGCTFTPAQNSVSGDLTVYFIDVGQADCALLVCGGQSMLVDAGNVDDGDAVVNFIRSLGIKKLDHIVVTHAHEDHVGGMSRVIKAFQTGKIYCSVAEHDNSCFRRFVSAAEEKGGLTLAKKGMQWQLGDAQVKVLWPQSTEGLSENNTSVVLKIGFGKINFLLMGDLESDSESVLCHYGFDLSADVLKVGHHGSSSSTSYLFLRSVMPRYAVISCEKGNSYGHPHKETLTKLEQAEAEILRTDRDGTVRMDTDGQNLTVTKGNDAVPSASPEPETAAFIGNVKSKKFHLPICPNLPAEGNRIIFQTREEALAQGYTPCGGCNP